MGLLASGVGSGRRAVTTSSALCNAPAARASGRTTSMIPWIVHVLSRDVTTRSRLPLIPESIRRDLRGPRAVRHPAFGFRASCPSKNGGHSAL